MVADYAGGAILAHQQIKISGGSNVQINGFIIAGDGQPTWTGDPFPNASEGVAQNTISANPTITFNGDFGCSGPACPGGAIQKVSWVEVFQP